MTYRQQAGLAYNFFLSQIGEVIKFYKKTIDTNDRDAGYATTLYAEELVVPMFFGKNTFLQTSPGQQVDVAKLSIRTTRSDLKGCVFDYINVHYAITDGYNTNGQDINGQDIYHYDTARG